MKAHPVNDWQTGATVQNKDGRTGTVERHIGVCPYTHTPLYRLTWDDGTVVCPVDPGWIPSGLTIVKRAA